MSKVHLPLSHFEMRSRGTYGRAQGLGPLRRSPCVCEVNLSVMAMTVLKRCASSVRDAYAKNSRRGSHLRGEDGVKAAALR